MVDFELALTGDAVRWLTPSTLAAAPSTLSTEREMNSRLFIAARVANLTNCHKVLLAYGAHSQLGEVC